MSSTMTTTFGTSNMRTSSRQTRTNPTRSSKTAGSSMRQNSLISNPPAAAPNAQEHGFYPAITHFTDAITALPREFRRHTCLLKEVDAKAWAPEAHLQTLLAACVTSKPPNNLPSGLQPAIDPTAVLRDPTLQAGSADGEANPIVDDASRASVQSQHDLQSFEHRKIFYHLRSTLTEMMVSMDEKNHLINGANEDLSKHLKRLTTIYPHIASEVSEEARLGSLTHWAYIDNKPPTRANVPSSRREAAAGLAAMHDTDIASRSESRREAMLARKQKQNQVDSDFDDPRPPKRANVNGKSRRVGEIAAESVPGLGITGAVPVVKRKRVDKAAAGGITMERSISGAMGGRPMSREPSQQEGTKKRKAPTSATTTTTTTTTTAAAAARKRMNTADSVTNSPKLVSSPLVGSFGKDAHRKSPMPGNNTRPASARARQNSTQGRPPSSASSKNNMNGVGVLGSTPELHNASATTGKLTEEIRNTIKESINAKGDKLTGEGSGALIMKGANGTKGGILLERSASRGGAINLKREEASASEENLSSKTKITVSPRLPPPTAINTDPKSTIISTRPDREREQRPSRARSSKTSTPIVKTFAESETTITTTTTTRDNHSRTDVKFKRPPSSSSRSARNKDPLHDSLSPSGLPPKRSHKKGAGLAAQAAVLQAKLAKQIVGGKAETPRRSSTSTPPSTATSGAGITDLENHHPTPLPAALPTGPTQTSPSPSYLSSPSPPPQINNNANQALNQTPPARPSLPPSEEEEEEEEEETLDSSGEEPRYCYCQQVSYGEMVACDAEDCPREWFHLECVGLERAPGRNARWFCGECGERLKGLIGGAGLVGAPGGGRRRAGRG